MNCPNCGNEINENQAYCSICGTKLNNQNEQGVYIAENKTGCKSFITGFIVAIIIAVVGYFGLTAYQDKVGKDGTFQSITPIEKTTIEYLSSKELLENLIEQENDIQQYAQRRRKPNINNIFETFYRNLSNSVQYITEEGLILVEKEENSPWYKSQDPETDLFEFSTNEVTGTRIDIHYLNKKYSKYLNSDWKKYLKLVENNREKVWTSAELGVNEKVIIDWIISWQKFLMKHPKFPLNDLVKAELKVLTTNILYHEYAFDNEQMTSETKAGYEDFLKRVNSTTKEYKIVKKCYNELKKNNYKTNTDFYRYLSEYSGQDWHKEMFKTFQSKEDTKLLEQKETRKKVGEHLYFDEKSLEKKTTGEVSGVFKQYIYTNEKKNGQKIAYKTIEISAYCTPTKNDNEQKLQLPVYKFYNFDEMIISKTDAKAQWEKSHPASLPPIMTSDKEENGNIYYKTLCEK